MEEFGRHLNKIWVAYRFANAVVIPSRYESFGYVALEALASRKLVITSDVGGLRETLAQERGILVKEGKWFVKELTRCLSWVMDATNKEKVEELIENGYQYVKDEYANKSTASMTEDLYKLYLSSVINGNLPLDYKRLKYDEMKINMEREILNRNGWKEIILAASCQYRVFRKSNFPDAPLEFESYDLFWEIARWIKQMKPLCPEVRIISHRDIAELITQIERILPK